MVLTRKQTYQIARKSTSPSAINYQQPILQSIKDLDEFDLNQKLVKFPEKLLSIIESKDNKSIKWAKNGKAIGIDPTEFQYELRIDSLGFKTKNFSSFTRQLNLYGFRKINCETNYLEYENPYFTKENPQLKRIKRGMKTPNDHSSCSDPDDRNSPTSSPDCGIKQEQEEGEGEGEGELEEKEVEEEEYPKSEDNTPKPKFFGSFYSQFDYYGKERNNSADFDAQFMEDSPSDAYYF